MQTIFFDLDGCLIDSRASIAACLDLALKGLGLAGLAESEIDAAIGPPIIQSCAALLAERSSSIAPEAMVGAFRKRYAQECTVSTRLMPGIADALDALRDRAHLVVVTSKALFLAERILSSLAINTRFKGVFGPAADALNETKMETLARAIAIHPATTTDCMIGDRAQDIIAGRHFGLRSIGVLWGSGSRAELEAAGADAVLHQASEIARLLAGVTF